MSDDLLARLLSMTDLVDTAEHWTADAENQTLPWKAREDARLNAACIYAELGLATTRKPKA